MPGPYMAAGGKVSGWARCTGGINPSPTDETKKLPAENRRGAQGCLPENYTRVFRTSCSGTGASMGRGAPSTHWMAFLGHLLTQVPQPLHLV